MKLSITCPNCKSVIYEDVLMVTGLQCGCGIPIRKLADATRKYTWVVYIISLYGKSLTDTIEYVGYTTNLVNRLKSHNSWMKTEKRIVRVSLRLSERDCGDILKPILNKGTCKSLCRTGQYEGCMYKLSSKYRYLHHDFPIRNLAYKNILKSAFTIEVGMIEHGRRGYNYESDWCYYRHGSCKCRIQCPYRKMWNEWLCVDKWSKWSDNNNPINPDAPTFDKLGRIAKSYD